MVEPPAKKAKIDDGKAAASTKESNDTHLVLAGDCGGTNTRLMLYSVSASEPIVENKIPPGRKLKEVKYLNMNHNSFEDIMRHFLKIECECGGDIPFPTVCVLAVAGVVANNTVRYTNLDWVVNGYDLQDALTISRVEIINDFVAQGYGALTLNDDEVIKVNDAQPIVGAPMACIGAGTGLGQCFLTPDGRGDYLCFPSEGGHVEFAPRGAGIEENQINMLKHLKVKFSGWNRVSIERVVSGKGICNVYEFLAHNFPNKVDRKVQKAFQEDPTNAGIVSKNALPGTLCEQAMQIFASCYGSQVGAMALQFMPFKGIYVTGGVTQKSLGFLQRDESFLDAYHDKGRVSPMLKKIPLYFVKSDDMGQRGAHYRAVQVLKQELEGRAPTIQKTSCAHFSKTDLPAPKDLDQSSLQVMASIQAFQNRKPEEKKNRRMLIPEGCEADYTPVFQGSLYKVIKVGSRSRKEDWVKRTFYIAKNGALVYASEDNDIYGTHLIYWNAEDLRGAVIREVPDGSAIMPFVFEVQPSRHSGELLVPSEFAATCEEERRAWVAKLRELGK